MTVDRNNSPVSNNSRTENHTIAALVQAQLGGSSLIHPNAAKFVVTYGFLHKEARHTNVMNLLNVRRDCSTIKWLICLKVLKQIQRWGNLFWWFELKANKLWTLLHYVNNNNGMNLYLRLIFVNSVLIYVVQLCGRPNQKAEEAI